jgi:peroxiredoxin
VTLLERASGRLVAQRGCRYVMAVLSLTLAGPATYGRSAEAVPPWSRGTMTPIPHPLTMLLCSESVRRELDLSTDQVAAIGPAVEQASMSLWRLRDLPPGNRDSTARLLVESLQNFADPAGEHARRERNALALLTERQRRRLVELGGPPFDVSALPAVACPAPELEGVTEWINSPPLTLAALRGKVVVVHFYTFGCINCIRNLPHYNDWRQRFDRDRLVILGIHRPETPKEYDIAEVRRKAAEAGLKYPVAVDNDSRNWNAWANHIWPSVYLIDKSGFVRYWWYGELNWQGAKGDPWMRARIAELLAARD